MAREAMPCPCGCENWLVRPEAALQGVHFTEVQARAVVAMLDILDEGCDDCGDRFDCPAGTPLTQPVVRVVCRRCVVLAP
jgi:hypothetical protein